MVSLNMVKDGLYSEVLQSMFFINNNSVQLSTKFDFCASKFENNCAKIRFLSFLEKHSARYLTPFSGTPLLQM